MVNQKIQVRMDQVQEKIDKLRTAPRDPQKRREIIREVVGDAQEYLEKELVFLRSL